ncbi:HIT family protein [Patulibacter brassicae]|jgi:histidine triad (HIT) family protein|uniref:HIT family protein n=1 Tax=Patulibacter brassicae TaxID=1705717 RepID=A0ABU4VIC4_9ACTN|nr:HIT family protein [Patulibacter brassicae]MDX8150889.1 HIT family protein [Patulibacter brassicae]
MADHDPDCVFCKIVAGELPARVIEEDERTIAFLDISPATPGHAVVIPRAHTADVTTASPEDLAAVAATGQRVARRALDQLDAIGVNLLNNCGARAWQTVFHLHLHVIPRYEDDGMRLPWIPTPGDPDAIAAVHARLTG